ncbi:glycoside hydrolase family 16 protein [Rhizobium sp. P32RR-XVIII]|uniref:glycoside hydrolase family 16 protein n=1 Tax=Rhizobium sp. P32RR-XVIII TaxID=2726738 RepID=UPI001456F120|nr:glycoside hydrolase family 16 protein [Rhizobium sp. P32RR-XVIII]NLS03697.1 glycoside hydrolase family 16 protein [Rhizobium sp. P32RR-XVIII]
MRFGSFVFLASVSIVAAKPAASAEAGHLDLCPLEPAFMEDFNDLSIAAWDIGDKRWIAHTPWNGDFGDAQFTDPGENFPFTLKDGIAYITARKDDTGKWRSGLLASADPNTKGFALQYGYFEIRTKLPSGPGVWPAFWLGTSEPRDRQEPSLEVDVIEYYGHDPASFQSAYHIWHKNPVRSDHEVHHTKVEPESLTKEFHTYGVQVDPENITYYFDRGEIWKVKTPETHKMPLLLMANLALGSGWPIDQTPNPSVMAIDYIHAYKFKSESERSLCPPS